MLRFLMLTAALLAAAPAAATDLPICAGGDRAKRRLTCIVDGDTGWERGVKWRLLHIDTPEISSPGCEGERQVGVAARDRLRALMGGGYVFEDSGAKDRTSDKRALVTIRLADGRDAGDVLMTEGLAQPWPNRGNVWCLRSLVRTR